VVSSPVVHYIISCLERSFFAIASWSEPCAWPCVVCTFPEFVRYFCRKSYCPSFSDLQNRSKSFDKVQTDHSCRHLSFCFVTAGVSASTEVSVVGHTPFCVIHDCFLVFFCDIPPLFHNSIAVFIFSFAVSIEACSTGVDQVKESASFFCNTFKVISCSFLNSFRAPVCTNVSEDLSSVCKEFHEHHSKTVENVILCSEDVWLTSSVPVEGCVQHSFCEVTVWIEVCPLSLSLETSCQSVVSDCFFGECRIKVIAAVHQLFDDNCHLNYKFKLLFFLFW